jgi:hypothetical protein
MDTCDPLALTKEQMEIVRTGAIALRPEWRAHYMSALSDALIGRSTVSDSDLTFFVGRAFGRLSSGADDDFPDCCGG